MEYTVIMSGASIIWNAAKQNKTVEGKITAVKIQNDKDDRIVITFKDDQPPDEKEQPKVVVL